MKMYTRVAEIVQWRRLKMYTCVASGCTPASRPLYTR